MNITKWVPVDMVADRLVELRLASSKALDHFKIDKIIRMSHVVTAKDCQREQLIPTVRQHLSGHSPVVPYEEWVGKSQNTIEA